jgi:hypothetical protein
VQATGRNMMILLTLALLAAPAALPVAVAEPQRHARSSKARRARARTPRTAFAIPIVQPPHDRNAKYRITDTADRIDFKTRVVERGAFKNCGVTGMPVCPSKGMPILTSDTQ